jgi:hypothetical protein
MYKKCGVTAPGIPRFSQYNFRVKDFTEIRGRDNVVTTSKLSTMCRASARISHNKNWTKLVKMTTKLPKTDL